MVIYYNYPTKQPELTKTVGQVLTANEYKETVWSDDMLCSVFGDGYRTHTFVKNQQNW